MMVAQRNNGELLEQGKLAEEEVNLERQAWMLERIEDEMRYEDPETMEEAKRRVRENI